MVISVSLHQDIIWFCVISSSFADTMITIVAVFKIVLIKEMDLNYEHVTFSFHRPSDTVIPSYGIYVNFVGIIRYLCIGAAYCRSFGILLNGIETCYRTHNF